ncbi:hypothetical protein AB0M20_08830 [Actinoplanes sp. NPDC051633]|uniref:hypothetical protein n=1 Tax=Actinoplanes sp. NPDC051633 TaxID=3155670 RepID=UPI00341A8E47
MRQHEAEQDRGPAEHAQPEGQHRRQLHVAESEPVPRQQRHCQIAEAHQHRREQTAADRVRRGETRDGHRDRDGEGADQRVGQAQAGPVDVGQDEADRDGGQQKQREHGPDRRHDRWSPVAGLWTTPFCG